MEQAKKPGFFSIYNQKTMVGAVGRCITIAFLFRLTLIYQTYVLLEIVKIPTDTFTLIQTITTIVSVVMVFGSGWIIERVNMRWGKARSWYFVSGTITAILCWALFTDFGFADGTGKWIFYGVLTALVPNTFNFMADANYIVMTKACVTQKDRNDNATVGMQVTCLFKILTGFGMVPAVQFLTTKLGEATGYSMYALVIVIIMFILAMITAKLAKRFDPPVSKEEHAKQVAELKANKEKQVSTKDMVKALFTRPMITIELALVFQDLGGMLASMSLVYYFTHVANNLGMMGVFETGDGLLAYAAAILAIPFVKLMKGDARKGFFVTFAGCAIGLFIAFFFGKSSVWAATIGLLIQSFFYSMSSACYMPMYMNDVEYVTIVQGKDTTSFLMSCICLSGKLASTFAGIIIAQVLAKTGFDAANVTAEASNGIMTMFALLPAIFFALGGICMYLQPYKKMMEVINEKHAHEHIEG